MLTRQHTKMLHANLLSTHGDCFRTHFTRRSRLALGFLRHPPHSPVPTTAPPQRSSLHRRTVTSAQAGRLPHAQRHTTHINYFNLLGASAGRHLAFSPSKKRLYDRALSSAERPVASPVVSLRRGRAACAAAAPWLVAARWGPGRAGPGGDGGGTRWRTGEGVGRATLARRAAVGGRRRSRCPACSHQHLGV